jgi:hypothetical protein
MNAKLDEVADSGVAMLQRASTMGRRNP